MENPVRFSGVDLESSPEQGMLWAHAEDLVDIREERFSAASALIDDIGYAATASKQG